MQSHYCVARSGSPQIIYRLGLGTTCIHVFHHLTRFDVSSLCRALRACSLTSERSWTIPFSTCRNCSCRLKKKSKRRKIGKWFYWMTLNGIFMRPQSYCNWLRAYFLNFCCSNFWSQNERTQSELFQTCWAHTVMIMSTSKQQVRLLIRAPHLLGAVEWSFNTVLTLVRTTASGME